MTTDILSLAFIGLLTCAAFAACVLGRMIAGKIGGRG